MGCAGEPITLSLYLIRLGDAVPNVEQVIGGKMTGGGVLMSSRHAFR
jgi:hypothetical protein